MTKKSKFPQGQLISYLVTCYFLLNGVNGVDYYTEQPAWLPKCKMSDPDFVQCSTNNVQQMLNQMFANGIPEIQETVGSLDPFKMDKVIYNRDSNEVATIKANLTDIDAVGFSNLKIVESNINKKNYNWITKCYIPRLRLDGNYKMNGRILLLPLTGAGKFFIDMEGVDLLMHTTIKLYKKADFIFYNITNIRIQTKLKGLKLNFDNLFNGKSKEVEISTNQFFNENWPDVFEALKPVINDTIEKILFKVLKRTFELLPATFLVEDLKFSKKANE